MTRRQKLEDEINYFAYNLGVVILTLNMMTATYPKLERLPTQIVEEQSSRLFVDALMNKGPVRLQLNPAAAGWFRLDRRQTGRKKRTARQHTAIGLATRGLSFGW